MSSVELENLVRIGQLKREPVRPGEVAGLVASGSVRLVDTRDTRLSIEGRFDLAYNAAHALALAALRRLDLRPANRYIVFQALAHTLAMDAVTVRVLSRSHDVSNTAEYEGTVEADEALVAALIAAASRVEAAFGPKP